MNISGIKAAAAFVKARAAMAATVKKDANGNYGKYATLAAVMEVVADELSNNNLALVQEVSVNEQGVMVDCTIVHESGEIITYEPLGPIPLAQRTAQGIGSGITYARRYQLTAIFGIAPDDDDGQEATKGTQRRPEQKKPTPEPPLQQGEKAPGFGILGRQPNGAAPKYEPTPEAVIESWRTSAEMLQWAIDVKGCANIHEAKNSWKNVLADHGGEVTDENRETIRRAFYDRQMEKAAEKQATPVAA